MRSVVWHRCWWPSMTFNDKLYVFMPGVCKIRPNMTLTRKRGNCECIATWGRPSHASPLPLWLRRHAKFDVAEPIQCRSIAFLLLIHYAMTLTSDFVTLTFDLEHLQRITCDMMKLCTKFERSRTIRGGVIAILVFDLIWPWTCFKCCAGLWDNFHQVWPSTTYTCLNYSVC